MQIVFDNQDVLKMSDKELFNIWKDLKRPSYIYLNMITILTVFVFGVYLFSLLYEWNWMFLVYAAFIVFLIFLYKNISIKFRDILLKMPSCRFESEWFYVGEKQFQYRDIEQLELGDIFCRIKIGRYKLVLIFKGKDKQEIDMLVAKLKVNAKGYKEV